MGAMAVGTKRRIVVGRAFRRGGSRRLDDPFVLSALAAVLLGAVWLAWLLAAPDFPGDDSADAGFARDMMRHHAQAVEMAMIVYQRTDDPVLPYIAYDIATTQQAQIGVMLGWLDTWGLPSTGSEPTMAWMGDPVEGLMPGMATQEEIDALRTLPVDEMEAQFLRLMIRHHQGGVLMAEGGEKLVETDQARDLAAGIVISQQSEIDLFQQLLEDRGLPRVADATTAGEGTMASHSGGTAETGMGHGEEDAGFAAGTGDALEATLRYLPITIGLFALAWLVADAVRRRALPVPDTTDSFGWRLIAVVALLLSAMLHAGLTPEHFDERTGYGVFFAASVVVEAAIAATIIAWPSSLAYLAGAAASFALIVVWGVFRITAPPGADAAEVIDLIGLITKATEVAALVACLRLWLTATRQGGTKEGLSSWIRPTVPSLR